MTTSDVPVRRLAFALIVSSLFLMAASAHGQRLTHKSGIPANRVQVSREAHPPTPCQGRCQFCVDGQCIPRHETFGFYETQWRRWPIEATEVVAPSRRPQPSQPELGPVVEVPAPHAESDVNPEFPHLRKTRPEAGAPPNPTLPPAQGKPPAPFDADNPFRDDLGMLPSKAPASPVLSPNASTGLRAVVPADYSQGLNDGPDKGVAAIPRHNRRDEATGRDVPPPGPTTASNPLRLAPPRMTVPPIRPTSVPVPLPKPNPHPQTPTSAPPTANPLRTR